jgi:hypothetical protein
MRKNRKGLQQHLPQFLREYRRKAQRGTEPNDRRYSRVVEELIKRMDPQELDRLMREADDADEEE